MFKFKLQFMSLKQHGQKVAKPQSLCGVNTFSYLKFFFPTDMIYTFKFTLSGQRPTYYICNQVTVIYR